jgi:hypothetical protein
MKILKGSFMETLYDWPEQWLVENGQAAVPALKRERTYSKNEVTYISGS